MAPVSGYPRCLEVQPFNIAGDAGGKQGYFTFTRALLAIRLVTHCNAVRPLSDFRDGRAGQNGDATLLELLAHACRNVGILDWQDLLLHFDQCDAGTHIIVEACKLGTGRPGTDDGHRGHGAIELKRLAIGQHLITIRFDVRRKGGARRSQ